MSSRLRIVFELLTAAVVLSSSTAARADVFTYGKVDAITDFEQMGPITGFEQFEGTPNTTISSSMDAAKGLTWLEGSLTQIIPGGAAQGNAQLGTIYDPNEEQLFSPVGDAVQNGMYVTGSMVAKFDVPVTQIGLVASNDIMSYLVAFDASGAMIGEVVYPPGAVPFVGLDSRGVPIAYAAFSGCDLWNGAPLDPNIPGYSDGWVWGPGGAQPPCASDADCDDGDVCDGEETCDPASKTCAHGAWPVCLTSILCQLEYCDASVGCALEADDLGYCYSNDFCMVNAHCENGACVTQPIECDDGDPCTVDSCNEGNCVYQPLDGVACDDDDACTDHDVCASGYCAGTQITCDDGNMCTDEASCDIALGCIHTFNDLPCDDGDACTISDTCTLGKCVGEAVDCDDGDPCTIDSCDRAIGCTNKAVLGCVACAAGDSIESCDDGDACTDDTCGPSGCEHAAIAGCCKVDGDCDDGETCESGECAKTSNGGCAVSIASEPFASGVGVVALLTIALGRRRARRVRSARRRPSS